VLSLDLDVNVDPLLARVANTYLDEAVHQPFAEFGVLHDLGEFLIEEDVCLPPVYFSVGEREIEGHELGKVARDRVFPRGIVVVARWCLVVHGWLLNAR